jgi:hypothetical protein
VLRKCVVLGGKSGSERLRNWAYSPRGRVASVEAIRAKITETLTQLGPDSEAAVWLEKMRMACREFLDDMATARHLPDAPPDLEPALHQLRDMFRTVAEHVSTIYRLPSATELVEEMNRADSIASSLEETAAAVAGFLNGTASTAAP